VVLLVDHDDVLDLGLGGGQAAGRRGRGGAGWRHPVAQRARGGQAAGEQHHAANELAAGDAARPYLLD
jgi:hypothetical protein